MNQSRRSELKWLGLILVFTGLGVIPLALLAFRILRLSLSEQDYHADLVMLLVLADGSLIAGVLLLVSQARSGKRHLK